MREPRYFVLASLLDGPLHGYAIMKRTAEMSGTRVRMATGMLYTALDRLTADGHVELTGARGDRRRQGAPLARANDVWCWCAASRGHADGGSGPPGGGPGPPPEGERQCPEGEPRVTRLERR
jgi:hypothetical protein